MFQRILIDHWMAIFPLVAFVTAASVYATITYQTLRWRRTKIERFAQLPFAEESPSHESEIL